MGDEPGEISKLPRGVKLLRAPSLLSILSPPPCTDVDVVAHVSPSDLGDPDNDGDTADRGPPISPVVLPSRSGGGGILDPLFLPAFFRRIFSTALDRCSAFSSANLLVKVGAGFPRGGGGGGGGAPFLFFLLFFVFF